MTTTPQLYKPIFLIGAARSGTTILADIISQHEDLAYWIEPKYIWRYGNASADDDVRDERDATSKVKDYITKRFSDYVYKRGKKRFIEKTPSNVFRVSFIESIFPDGLYIHLIRDGREVTISAERKSNTPPDKSALKRRLLSNEIPYSELPFYLISGITQLLKAVLLKKQGKVWGPRYSGIKNDKKKLSQRELSAKQWSQSVEYAHNGLRKIDPDRIMEVRFEQLMAQPTKTIKDILSFVELSTSPKVLEYATTKLDKKKIKTISADDLAKLSEVKNILAPGLKLYGYS